MSSFRTTAPSLPSCAYTASINGVTSSQAVRQVSRSVPIAAHTRYAANHTANGTIELARGALLY